MEQQRRLGYIDTAKGIAIILVILGHTPIGFHLVARIIYSFHMPLFFMLSGMVFHANRTPRDFFMRAARSLLVPYILFALIYANGFTFENLGLILYGTRNSLMAASSNSALWFLPCIFLSRLMVYVIDHIAFRIQSVQWRRVYNAAVLCMFLTLGWICSFESNILTPRAGLVAAYGLPFGFGIAFAGAFFLFLGRYIAMAINWLNSISWWKTVLGTILCIVFGVLLAEKNCANPSLALSSYPVMALSVYGNYALFIIAALFLSVGIVLLSKLIDTKFLRFLGKNSVLVLGLHVMILNALFAARVALSSTIHLPGTLSTTLIMTGITVAFLPLPILIIRQFYHRFPTEKAEVESTLKTHISL